MKKVLAFVSLAVLLFSAAGCAPGEKVEVTTPESRIQLTTPGPNPEQTKPDASGHVAGALLGLWHGLIAPVTLVLSFFNPAYQMYEVHNNGPEYNLGFLIGVAVVFLFLGILGGGRRRRR